jgi:hypothetical protein
LGQLIFDKTGIVRFFEYLLDAVSIFDPLVILKAAAY